ncbi:MAG: hypothetical protein ABSE51_09855 [Terracidiphilus sp.]
MAAVLTIGIEAQVGDPATLIQEKLASQIKLTKTAADRSDIVTAGDVVVLHKDGLKMCSSTSLYAFPNSYSDGVLLANNNTRAKDLAKSFLRKSMPFGSGANDAAGNGCPSRKFVAGEKFWITGIALQKDGIVVSTFSDPYNDVRYYGEIKFPFPKSSVPAVDDFVKTVSEVITVQPADDKGDQANQGGQPAQSPQSTAAPAQMQAIAPPPPPADAPPPTIALGQTVDQVTAAFGQPQRMAKLGVKQIFYYKDMRVTFTNGKVSNVE